MSYSANIEYAFSMIENIMRNIEYGWLIRYIHSNGASIFFILVYLHIAKALYYGSYNYPRYKLWNIGVIIYILMMATAFLG
jgi:quinol-cytochrome oxidoreductase complex cytochrome b subunit